MKEDTKKQKPKPTVYNKIEIRRSENGYIVTAEPTGMVSLFVALSEKGSNKVEFVFNTLTDLNAWLKKAHAGAGRGLKP